MNLIHDKFAAESNCPQMPSEIVNKCNQNTVNIPWCFVVLCEYDLARLRLNQIDGILENSNKSRSMRILTKKLFKNKFEQKSNCSD